jgi:hypothetical protein
MTQNDIHLDIHGDQNQVAIRLNRRPSATRSTTA